VPKLLEMLSLKGTIVTALNCQRDIARRIVDQDGDDVLALKGNQGTLHAEVRLFLDDPETKPTGTQTTVDGDHGRIDTCTVSTDIGWLQEVHDWPGLNAIGKVIRIRETGAKVTTETAYYRLSTPLSAERFGPVARSHWAVENSLHGCLDVIMNEDKARNRLDKGPDNRAILRHMALNLIRKEPGSLRVKIKRAAWKDPYLAKGLAQI
jgi:predicted transposase YbfD/YdcC